MDVLPAQASSVACERLFSSSKDTCTARRNKLSPDMIEALQQLKYSFREDRQSLDFVSHPQAKECDYGIDGKLSTYAMDELVSTKKWDELWDLLQNSRSGQIE